MQVPQQWIFHIGSSPLLCAWFTNNFVFFSSNWKFVEFSVLKYFHIFISSSPAATTSRLSKFFVRLGFFTSREICVEIHETAHYSHRSYIWNNFTTERSLAELHHVSIWKEKYCSVGVRGSEKKIWDFYESHKDFYNSLCRLRRLHCRVKLAGNVRNLRETTQQPHHRTKKPNSFNVFLRSCDAWKLETLHLRDDAQGIMKDLKWNLPCKVALFAL